MFASCRGAVSYSAVERVCLTYFLSQHSYSITTTVNTESHLSRLIPLTNITFTFSTEKPLMVESIFNCCFEAFGLQWFQLKQNSVIGITLSLIRTRLEGVTGIRLRKTPITRYETRSGQSMIYSALLVSDRIVHTTALCYIRCGDLVKKRYSAVGSPRVIYMTTLRTMSRRSNTELRPAPPPLPSNSE